MSFVVIWGLGFSPLTSRCGIGPRKVLTPEDISLTFEDMSVVRGTSLSNYPRLVHELGGDPLELHAHLGVDLARRGHTLDWGPTRHGPGFNFAAYVRDPDNAVIEVYADLLQIPDERAYERIDWSNEPRALNLWGPMPSEELLAAGVPIVAADAHVAGSPA